MFVPIDLEINKLFILYALEKVPNSRSSYTHFTTLNLTIYKNFPVVRLPDYRRFATSVPQDRATNSSSNASQKDGS